MALRNALGEIGLEGTLRRLLDAVTFAKDPGQRLRIVNDGGSVNTNGSYNNLYFGASNTWPNRYSSGAPNAFDARDWQQQNSEVLAMRVHSRWTVT